VRGGPPPGPNDRRDDGTRTDTDRLGQQISPEGLIKKPNRPQAVVVNTLDLRTIDELTGGKLGVNDVSCPFCGPERRSPANQRRRVMRVWRLDPAFATFHCARCGESGHVRDSSAARVDPAALKRAKREAADREREATAERLGKARRLWSRRRPLAGSIGETYLRQARRYGGPLPATLGFLPARGGHGPALIAAFGMPEEPEFGQLRIADDAVQAVHLVRLAADGLARVEKISVGPVAGSPVVVAPVSDLLGLAVCEGLEDAASVHEMTGLGCWASAGASHLPALADSVPDYVESISIFSDGDAAGELHSAELAARLRARGFEVVVVKARS
jgi:hypothetical protein